MPVRTADDIECSKFGAFRLQLYIQKGAVLPEGYREQRRLGGDKERFSAAVDRHAEQLVLSRGAGTDRVAAPENGSGAIGRPDRGNRQVHLACNQVGAFAAGRIRGPKVGGRFGARCFRVFWQRVVGDTVAIGKSGDELTFAKVQLN